MATTVARLSSNGVYFTSNYFDELNGPVFQNSITPTVIYSSEFDEVTIQGIGGGLAKRETNDGRILISGYFDEVSGINDVQSLIGSTTSTVNPTTNNNVTVGTTNGSPFGTSVNSYQFATQPASAPYNSISVAGGSGFAVGTGDFTIEWFQYQTVAASFARILWYGTAPSLGISLEGTAYLWGSGPTALASYGTILNTWVHFALVRISGKVFLYKNGTLINAVAGTNFTNNITDTSSTFYIGSKAGSGLQSEQFSGSITSFRFVKGLGVYTGNFTKPTSKLGQTQSANPYGGSNTLAITSGQCSLLLNP